MPLRPHQVRAAEQFVKHCTDSGMLLWHRMGTGKTSTVLSTLMNYPHDQVLLLHPAGLRDVWTQEVETRFGGAVPFKLQFMDYDTFMNKHVRQQVTKAVQNATLVVADEAHHLAEDRHTSMQLLRNKRCLLVTGTPVYHALTDLAVLVNLAAGADVLPVKDKQLQQLVQSGDMYDKIKKYVQYYDFGADANAQLYYPVVRLVNVTMPKQQLPLPKPGDIVYSQQNKKLAQVASQLQRANRPVLLLTKQDKQVLQQFATGNYVLLLHAALAEGVTVPNATVLHVLEPVHTYGLQQQLYARVKRPVASATRPVHTIYQYMQPHRHVDHTLADTVRTLRRQMERRQTSVPTCRAHVRACDVWKSTTEAGTCGAQT